MLRFEHFKYAETVLQCLTWECEKDLTQVVEQGLKRIGVTMSKLLLAVLCLIFGVIVIVWSEFLSIVVGLFLIIEGILLLADYLELQRQQPKPPPPPA
jgi:uncharacterized membrane protein HdeD (DUF308 family)